MWLPIPNYEDNYEVNSSGEIRRAKNGNILKGYIGKDGYRRVGLTVNSKTKSFLIHRLVAEAFIPNPNGYPCINHKDEDKTNNHVNNLEWCNYEYNLNYGTRNSRANNSRKKAILQFSKTGEFIKAWDSGTDVYLQMGIDKGHISDCCNNKRKTAGGYRWQYKN